MVSLLTLLVVQHAEFLAIFERLRLASPTPVARWLHAVVGVVCEVTGAFRATEDSCSLEAFLALRVAPIEAFLFIRFALSFLPGASALSLDPARFRWLIFLRWLWLRFFFLGLRFGLLFLGFRFGLFFLGLRFGLFFLGWGRWPLDGFFMRGCLSWRRVFLKRGKCRLDFRGWLR